MAKSRAEWNDQQVRADKLRRGFKERAENDTAEELGFRVQRINGQVFIVYQATQEYVPGLGGAALESVWNYAVRQRYNTNLGDTGKMRTW